VAAAGVLHDSTDRFVLQDEASQTIPLLVGAQPGHRVLDLCAAPGGKTTAIAGDMQDRGVLVACDVRERRVRVLRAAVVASGAHAVRVLQVDRDGPLPFAPVFDRVLVDAPCSGLGTLRRDPDIKWRRVESDLAGFAATQRTLLDRAAGAVAPGGRLVYATCSSEPEENEAVVEWFLGAHPGFRSDPQTETLPAQLAPLVDAQGFLQTLPHRHGLEAFFGAAFVRA
jgi:16S rRNA (cytosine967-C5)-methyltransferase